MPDREFTIAATIFRVVEHAGIVELCQARYNIEVNPLLECRRAEILSGPGGDLAEVVWPESIFIEEILTGPILALSALEAWLKYMAYLYCETEFRPGAWRKRIPRKYTEAFGECLMLSQDDPAKDGGNDA